MFVRHLFYICFELFLNLQITRLNELASLASFIRAFGTDSSSQPPFLFSFPNLSFPHTQSHPGSAVFHATRHALSILLSFFLPPAKGHLAHLTPPSPASCGDEWLQLFVPLPSRRHTGTGRQARNKNFGT